MSAKPAKSTAPPKAPSGAKGAERSPLAKPRSELRSAGARSLVSASLATAPATGTGRASVAGSALAAARRSEVATHDLPWFSGGYEGLREQGRPVEQAQRMLHEVAERITQAGKFGRLASAYKLVSVLESSVHVPLRKKLAARGMLSSGVDRTGGGVVWFQGRPARPAKLDPSFIFEQGLACGALMATEAASSRSSAMAAVLAELRAASEVFVERPRGESADLANPISRFIDGNLELVDAARIAQEAALVGARTLKLGALLAALEGRPVKLDSPVRTDAPSGAAVELQRAAERLQARARAAPGTSKSSVDHGELARQAWISDGLVVPSTELATAWGRTRQALDQAVKRGELFRIGIRNRKWYLAVFKELAAADVAKVCRELHRLSDAEQLVFWLRPHGALGGATVEGAFRSRRVGDVIALAKAYAEGLGAPQEQTQPLDDSKT